VNLKAIFKFSSIAAAALISTGCMSGRALPVAGPDDLSRGVRRFPDLTREELAAGRSLYGSRCAQCHVAPDPASRRAEEWPAEIREMRERARLTEKDTTLIERYVVTMSEAPALDTAGARVTKTR
jgi:hypothetical protein